MTNAQEFNTEARAFCLEQADKVVKECKECGGTGYIEVISDAEDDKDKCPSCTPEADKWRKLADAFCWHEFLDNRKHDPNCPCGDVWGVVYHSNPTYDKPADIADAFKRMGLFDRFVEWHLANCLTIWIVDNCFGKMTSYDLLAHAEILTDPVLFLEAGTNFLREVVGQP